MIQKRGHVLLMAADDFFKALTVIYNVMQDILQACNELRDTASTFLHRTLRMGR